MKRQCKSTLLLSILSLTLILSTGCRKESTKTYSIDGLWVGTYTVNSQPELGDQYYSFIIKDDGSLIVETEGNLARQVANGTWTLSNKTLTVSYIYVYGDHVDASQTGSATWNGKGSLTGTWQDEFPGPNSGSFTLHRAN